VRNALLVLVAVAALCSAGAAAAAQPPRPDVLCGPACDPPGGYTGCTSISASRGASAWLVYSIRHVLVVNFCKSNGIITSWSIAAHYCDVGGFASCTPTVAWLTGGGRGATYATFEAHATWSVSPAGIYNNTDVLNLTVPTG
jgi:hypothetical protein